MPDCTAKQLEFERFGRRRVEARFGGGEVSSDSGLLMRQLDRRLVLIDAVAAVLADPRDPERIEHSPADPVCPRVLALAQGYEDLNDHAALRTEMRMRTACERDRAPTSAPTLCRLKNRAARKASWASRRVMLEQFIASFTTPREGLVLDFDATDDPMHGKQEGRFFPGYYGNYCYLPLYASCDEQLPVSYPRPAKIDGAKRA